MRRAAVGWVLLVAVATSGDLRHVRAAELEPDRWEPAIRAFEAQDRREFPPKEGILFLGSSSIAGWDVKKYFPGLPVINRGFGGSQIADSIRYVDRIVVPYAPKTIVFYAGDNDVAAGKSPQQVLADYERFVEKVHRSLPGTRIVFIAIKPSISRWKLVDTMRRANELIRAVAEKDPKLEYVDVDAPMIGSDGRPRPELFRQDGLHLNARGYELWSKLARPFLKLPSAAGSGALPDQGRSSAESDASRSRSVSKRTAITRQLLLSAGASPGPGVR